MCFPIPYLHAEARLLSCAAYHTVSCAGTVYCAGSVDCSRAGAVLQMEVGQRNACGRLRVFPRVALGLALQLASHGQWRYMVVANGACRLGLTRLSVFHLPCAARRVYGAMLVAFMDAVHERVACALSHLYWRWPPAL